MRNICTHPQCLFFMVFFPALPYTTHESHANVDCKHKIFVNFGFVLITYILFPFPFSLLHNLSSFHQCLYTFFVALNNNSLTKTLLPPSFSQKCSIEHQ